jgi:zinc protease
MRSSWFGIPLVVLLTASASAAAPTEKAAVPSALAPKSKVAAPAPHVAVQALERLAISLERRTLGNGLRVVLAPDTSSPTVAVSVTYGVGSRDETTGKSGFAHLFEHMMFQGSVHVKKGQHFGLIAERGGTLNGTTSADRTNYFEVLPASELELALWLESDRMRGLDISSENFENQRAVVKEEYRMRYANAPYMLAALRLGELVFANYPPYANPTIGKMEDLDGAKLEWVREFYDRHYAPSNAVLTIAGGFEKDRALALVEKYFGVLPGRPGGAAPKTALPDPEPRVARERMEDPNAKTPSIFYGWLIPRSRTPEHYALEIAAMLLGDGESARLYQRLVRTRAVALETRAWTRDFEGPDTFGVQAVLSDKAKLDEVTKELDQELERLRKTPPTAAELARAKQRIQSSFVFGLETSLNRAVELGQYELFLGDARGFARELTHYHRVTGEEVRAAAQRYLGPERRVVLEVTPKSGGKP